MNFNFFNIYYADLTYNNSSDHKDRPVLLIEISSNKNNLKCLKITSAEHKGNYINYILIEDWHEAGLTKESLIDLDEIYNIPKSAVRRRVGILSNVDLSKLLDYFDHNESLEEGVDDEYILSDHIERLLLNLGFKENEAFINTTHGKQRDFIYSFGSGNDDSDFISIHFNYDYDGGVEVEYWSKNVPFSDGSGYYTKDFLTEVSKETFKSEDEFLNWFAKFNESLEEAVDPAWDSYDDDTRDLIDYLLKLGFKYNETIDYYYYNFDEIEYMYITFNDDGMIIFTYGDRRKGFSGLRHKYFSEASEAKQFIKDTVEESLNESVNNTAVLIWGRMNPITKAHIAMIDFAKQQGGDTFVYLSHKQDKDKNPLSYDRKIYWAQKAAGSCVKESNANVIITALQEIQAKGYKKLIYVCGSDRYNEMTDLLDKYNGMPDRKGNIPFKFDSIEVRQFGEDRLDEGISLKQCSASLARKCVREDDFETFKQVVPFDEANARELFDELKGTMSESLTEALMANKKIMPGNGHDYYAMVLADLQGDGVLTSDGKVHKVTDGDTLRQLVELSDEQDYNVKVNEFNRLAGFKWNTIEKSHYSGKANGGAGVKFEKQLETTETQEQSKLLQAFEDIGLQLAPHSIRRVDRRGAISWGDLFEPKHQRGALDVADLEARTLDNEVIYISVKDGKTPSLYNAGLGKLSVNEILSPFVNLDCKSKEGKKWVNAAKKVVKRLLDKESVSGDNFDIWIEGATLAEVINASAMNAYFKNVTGDTSFYMAWREGFDITAKKNRPGRVVSLLNARVTPTTVYVQFVGDYLGATTTFSMNIRSRSGAGGAPTSEVRINTYVKPKKS